MFGLFSVWMDVWFKRTPEGWTFNSSYPRIFGRPSTYLLTDAHKATLTERLGRTLLISRVLAFTSAVASGVLAAFSTPHFVSRLDAGSLEAWLLVFVVAIALGSVLVAAIAFVSRRAVQPVLCTARRVGPAQPDRLGFIILKEMIRRYTERKSAKVLIIWIALLFIFSAYGKIIDALVVHARSVLMFFGIVVSWLATLSYVALLVFKLRAQRSRR